MFSFKPSQSCPTKHREGINVTVAQSGSLPEKGLQNTTVAQVLLTKGEEKVGYWLWCRTDDSVDDAIKQVNGREHRIFGGPKARRTAADSRNLHRTRISSGTNVVHAMQLMTDKKKMNKLVENHIRHAPVIDGKIVGMISMVDVVRAVLEQQHGEVKRLNDLFQGDYY
ncbi:hypothetical protein ACS0TY_025610 [Phlomoides rotata]